MDKKDRDKIEQQLIAEAEKIKNDDNDVEIIADTVSTCQSLLRIIDRSIPDTVSKSDFEDILSAYIGLTSRIKYFYQNNSEYISDGNAKLLNEMLMEINILQRNKSKLDIEYDNKTDELYELKKSVEKKETEVSEIEEQYDKAKEAVDVIKKRIKKLNSETESLKKEEVQLKEEVEYFQPIMEELIGSINKLKDQYKELTAYYTEFERIRQGIKEDGFVDMRDFNDKVKSRIDEGEELMKWCDNILKALLEDVETLQEKVEKRRKEGAY